jgi:hypothetical protein
LKRKQSPKPQREPWNKGKLIGQKPPLRAKHVWSIRARLQIEGRTRDLAIFNLAIDSKLRGCELGDGAHEGWSIEKDDTAQGQSKGPAE